MKNLYKILLPIVLCLVACERENFLSDSETPLVPGKVVAGRDGGMWRDGAVLRVKDNGNKLENSFSFKSGVWSRNENEMPICWNNHGVLDITAYIDNQCFTNGRIELPLDNKGRIDQSDPEKLESCDLLYYKNSSAGRGADGWIRDFALEHLLAKVVLTVSVADNFSGTVTDGFSGVLFSSKKIMYYTDDKWIGENKAARAVIPYAGNFDKEKRAQTFTAYIVPTMDDFWECNISLRTDSEEFSASTRNLKLEGGKIYNLSLILSDNEIKWGENIKVEDWSGSQMVGDATHEYILEAWDGSIPSEHKFKGNGTENEPYIVASAAELAYLGKVLRELNAESSKEVKAMASAYYQLVADLDMGDMPFIPIVSSQKLSMKFSGGGHTIYNLNLAKGESYTALVESGCVSFYDLSLENVQALSDSRPAAAFIGNFNPKENATIADCHIINGCIKSDGVAGGFVGATPRGGGDKKMSLVACSITESVISGTYCGGLVGENYAVVDDISGCYSCNNVISGVKSAGGLTGKLTDRKTSEAEKTTVNIRASYTWDNDYSLAPAAGTFIGEISGGLPKNLVFNACHFNNQADCMAVGAYVPAKEENEMPAFTQSDNAAWKAIAAFSSQEIEEMNVILKEYSENQGYNCFYAFSVYTKYPLLVSRK